MSTGAPTPSQLSTANPNRWRTSRRRRLHRDGRTARRRARETPHEEHDERRAHRRSDDLDHRGSTAVRGRRARLRGGHVRPPPALDRHGHLHRGRHGPGAAARGAGVRRRHGRRRHGRAAARRPTGQPDARPWRGSPVARARSSPPSRTSSARHDDELPRPPQRRRAAHPERPGIPPAPPRRRRGRGPGAVARLGRAHPSRRHPLGRPTHPTRTHRARRSPRSRPSPPACTAAKPRPAGPAQGRSTRA